MITSLSTRGAPCDGQFAHEGHIRWETKVHDGTLTWAIDRIQLCWAITNRRSTTRYCLFIGGNLVTWRSKKQFVVARYTVEIEFRAMARGIRELH